MGRAGGTESPHPVLSHPGIGKGEPEGRRPPAQPFAGEQGGLPCPGAEGFGKTLILSILRAAARQPGARVCVAGGCLVWGLGAAGDAAGWCWSSGSVPPPRTVIWSGSLTRPSIFHASKNLALSPPAPLPGMPSLSPGPCIPAVSEPLAAAADAGERLFYHSRSEKGRV